ncbi:hypothetical protein FACS189472_10300 [Alphaproteobacteria bacterium]|nr:hypothetical protein FACS189472_10300 [Alphaproteobacteria bacterium]
MLKLDEPFTRWDHMEHYSKNDVKIMISALCNLILDDFEQGVDTLQNVSRASISNAQKFASMYRDFDVNAKYEDEVKGSPYYFSQAKCRHMYYRYKEQDEAAERDITDIVKEENFEELKEMFTGTKKGIKVANTTYNQGECKGCGKRFSTIYHPTLDRIDNDKCQSIDNVFPSCTVCNVKHNRKPIEDVMLPIKLHCYALKKNNPFTIDSEEVYHILKKFNTGGIANVHRKYTKAGETKITNLEFDGEHVNVIQTEVV